MIIPVRCFTCGKILGNKWTPYQDAIKNGKTANDALNELGVKKYCCRSIMLSHVPVIDNLLKFN